MEMKDFFFYSAPTSPRSSHHHSSLFDYDDDDVAVLDDVPLLSRHHHDHGALSSSENTTCDSHNELSNEDEAGNEQAKDDFEFCFGGQLDMMAKPSLSSADELFDGGKIRPLKLKVKPDSEDRQTGSKDLQHPYEAASCSSNNKYRNPNDGDAAFQYRGRGRGRATNLNANTSNNRGGSHSGRKGISRSLSPLRVSEFALLQHQHQHQHDHLANSSSSSSCSRKWRLKDLFLFRSASEGNYKNSQSFSKRWSFRTSSTMDSESGSGSKRRGRQVQGSAHEMHYTTKRAVSEDMKKKTSLPYKHGLLACLGFSPILPQFSYTFPSSPTLS